MFILKFALKDILKSYRLTLALIVVIALAVVLTALTLATAAALKKASDSSSKPLKKLGADMLVILEPNERVLRRHLPITSA